MHKPRSITLTERELRVLRAIERTLADEDPVLALVLRGPDADDTSRAQKAARRRQRRNVWGYPVTALSVLVLAMLAAAGVQPTVMLVLMLAAVPIAVHFGAAFPGPSDRRGRTDGDDPNGPNHHR
jgi:Flp pilus assembly protein TadB